MPRTEEQNERIKRERREAIWKATLAAFYEKGLHATSISDIAQRAGMSKGLLYHYYESKTAIYTDIVEDALDKMIEATQTLRTTEGTVGERIRLALRELLKTIAESQRFCETCRFIAEAMNPNAIPEETRAIIDPKRDVPYRIIADLLRQGQEENSIVEGDPEMLAILFWTSVNGLAIYYATRNEQEVSVPDYRVLAKIFVR